MKLSKLSSRVRRALHGSSRGLTLVEVVIAMALIAIIGVAFLGGLSQAIWSLHIADVRTTAESLARSEMEYIKSQPYEPAPWEDQKKFEGYTITAAAIALDDPDEPEDERLQEITVIVTHDERELGVTLIGYRAKR